MFSKINKINSFNMDDFISESELDQFMKDLEDYDKKYKFLIDFEFEEINFEIKPMEIENPIKQKPKIKSEINLKSKKNKNQHNSLF